MSHSLTQAFVFTSIMWGFILALDVLGYTNATLKTNTQELYPIIGVTVGVIILVNIVEYFSSSPNSRFEQQKLEGFE